MGRPLKTTLVLAAAADNNISLSQAVAGAGNLTITGSLAAGGVATLDVARRVLISSSGNDSGITFTLTGTNRDGGPISEVVTGANTGSVYTLQDFLTVSKIAASGAVAGTVKVGTNGVGSSRWILLNRNAQPFQVGIGVTIVSGSANYTVETTMDDIMGEYSAGFNPVWVNAGIPLARPDMFLAGQANSGGVKLEQPCQAVRVTLNSGTGTVAMTVIQAGIHG